MAIQLRGGISSLLVKSKLKPREACITTDTGEFYYCYAPGQVKKAATAEELQTLLNASPEAYAALQQLIADLELNPSELTNILSNISALQSDKIDKTGDSADNTVSFTEASTDVDMASGDSHAILFGKIKKRFSVIASSLSGKFDKVNIIQTTAVDDAAKVPSSAVTYSLAHLLNTANGTLQKLTRSSYSTNTAIITAGDNNYLEVPYSLSCAKVGNVVTISFAVYTKEGGWPDNVVMAFFPEYLRPLSFLVDFSVSSSGKGTLPAAELYADGRLLSGWNFISIRQVLVIGGTYLAANYDPIPS